MAQCVFEIDVLARHVSCHLVSFSRNAAVSLARTRKMHEVPAFSSLWDLQDSLSVLSNVLPSTDEVRNHTKFSTRLTISIGNTSSERQTMRLTGLNGSTRVPKPTPSHMSPLKGPPAVNPLISLLLSDPLHPSSRTTLPTIFR